MTLIQHKAGIEPKIEESTKQRESISSEVFALSQSTFVLLVDDDEATFIAYQRVFERAFGDDVTIRHCQNEYDLERKMSENDFSVVILDQRLNNGVKGLDLIPRIRRSSPSSQVFINSAYGSERLAAQAVESGADGYILGKKSDDSKVVEAVQNAIKSKSSLQNIVNEINEVSAPLKMKAESKLKATRLKIKKSNEIGYINGENAALSDI